MSSISLQTSSMSFFSMHAESASFGFGNQSVDFNAGGAEHCHGHHHEGGGFNADQFSAGFAQGFAQAFSAAFQGADHCGCSCPDPKDAGGGLKKDDQGVITTPGGYKIKSEGASQWSITGPDGKSTNISGDPHVAESDGGKWDFKKNSTFQLDDGTKINVNTKDAGNGMTVTQGLDITNGDDRVQVSNIDQGPGQVGEITHDAADHANDYANNDVIQEGKDAAQWGSQGKEITGSNNGGDSFQLGQDLAGQNPKMDQLNALRDLAGDAGDSDLRSSANSVRKMLSVIAELLQNLQSLQGPSDLRA